jgi:hypothetical protein
MGRVSGKAAYRVVTENRLHIARIAINAIVAFEVCVGKMRERAA